MPFQKGQSGNPSGRPSQMRDELRTLLEKEFSQTKRRAVLRTLVEDAVAGDKDARQLLMAYTFGKPTEYKEISGNLTAYIVDIDSDSDDDPTDANPSPPQGE